MITDLADAVYRDLKQHLATRCEYGPRVVQKSLKQSDKFPLVTVEEDDNSNVLVDTTFRDKTDKVAITINIYAEDLASGNRTISNANVAKEISVLVDEVLGRKYKMLRTACKRTPNLDDNIYRITMRYTKKMISNKKILI